MLLVDADLLCVGDLIFFVESFYKFHLASTDFHITRIIIRLDLFFDGRMLTREDLMLQLAEHPLYHVHGKSRFLAIDHFRHVFPVDSISIIVQKIIWKSPQPREIWHLLRIACSH